MIKINLLPQKDMKRRRPSGGGGGGIGGGAGSNVMALFGLVLILELGGLYYWYMQADAAGAQGADTSELTEERGRLEKLKRDAAELDKLEVEVGKQRVVFKGLQNNKVGPVNLLLFVSYVLRQVSRLQQEEYSVLTDVWAAEAAGAKKAANADEWNPKRVWINGISEKEGELTIHGGAKDHEDVMVFMQRLKTGIYFEGVDLVEQQIGKRNALGQTYVTFKLTSGVNFDPAGFPPLPTEE